MSDKGYIWYSFGSDKSGPVLAEALDFAHGKKTPKPSEYGIIIGWGCKAGNTYDRSNFKKAVAERKLRILNSVESVEANRNKLETLKRMETAGVMTPGIIERDKKDSQAVVKAIRSGRIALPLLGLTQFHKGKPHFFYTVEDIERADPGIEYFRSFVPGTEYRVHVMRNMVLLVQRKQLAKDPAQAASEELLSRLKRRVEKADNAEAQKALAAANPETMKIILEEIAPELVSGPSQIQRSVSMGWELVDVELKMVPEKVKAEAIRALDAVELDIGAVSVTMDDKDPHSRAVVTAVTTGPALSDKHLAIYVQALKDFAANSGTKDPKPSVRKMTTRKAPKELVAKITEKVAELNEKDARRILAYLEAE